MNKVRLLAAMLGASLVIAAVAPTASGASSTDDLSKAAQQASSLNDLQATDDELMKAMATLNGEVAIQQAAVDSARQAYEAAVQQVIDLQAGLKQTEEELVVLGKVAREQAVEMYMSPGQDDAMSTFLASEALDDAVRRDELMKEVAVNHYDALDKLSAAQRQYDQDRKKALEAQETADKRRQAEEAKLETLKAAQAEQARLDKSLKARIEVARQEDEASAAAQNYGNGRASRSDASEDDTRISAAGLRWPMSSHKVNSPYGQRWGRMHSGIDIQASIGTPIYAAKAGTVTQAGSSGGYGNLTCINHGGNFMTCYGHQSRITVSVGQSVGQGQQIGLSGNTGSSTGPHLHFETCISSGPACFYGTYKNPQNYLP